MDIFTSLPNAIVYNVWQIGKISRSTEVGKTYEAGSFISPIVDEEATGGQNNSPSADFITSQTMLFIRPSDMPTTNIAELLASYFIKNTETGDLYEITNVGVGKNQDTGVIEHYELLLLPTEAMEDE